MVSFSRFKPYIYPFARKSQKVGNAVGPYVLGNIGAAAALVSGIESWDELADFPSWLKDAEFYVGLGVLNAGVLVPSIREGAGNYVKSLIGRIHGSSVTLTPTVKSALLLGALGFGLANSSIRDSSAEALYKVSDDVASLLGSEPKDITELSSLLPPSGRGDQSLVELLQAQHDHWRKTPHTQFSKQMMSRPKGKENWAICAQDLQTGEYLVDFNCNEEQMVASANKIPILIAYFHELAEQRFSDRHQRTLERMIRDSSNPATNNILALLGDGDTHKGVERVHVLLASYGFPHTRVEAIPRGGRTLGNVSTAAELNGMLARIYNPALYSEDLVFPYAERMKRILGLDSVQGHKDRLLDDTCIPTNPGDLESPVAAYANIYDKTGYIYGANVNSAVIDVHFKKDGKHFTVPYVLTLLVQDSDAKEERVLGNYRTWGKTKSAQMRRDSELIFWRFYEKYMGHSYACRKHKGRHGQ